MPANFELLAICPAGRMGAGRSNTLPTRSSTSDLRFRELEGIARKFLLSLIYVPYFYVVRATYITTHPDLGV